MGGCVGGEELHSLSEWKNAHLVLENLFHIDKYIR